MIASRISRAIFSVRATELRKPSSSWRYRFISTQIPLIRPTEAEIRAGRLTDHNLERAVNAVREDGILVVENVIDHRHLDTLNKRMLADTAYLSNLGDAGPFNYNKSNIQQDPPPFKEDFEPSIFLNPIATHITSTVLGPRPKLTFVSGNTALPAAKKVQPQRQPVHSDADFAHPKHPFALVVNVPLVTMTPENGSTEIWPGTHNQYGIDAQSHRQGERASGQIKQDLLQEQRSIRPPIQPIVPKGSIVIRDLRLWHAGMPNHSKHVRIMLAMIHFAPWYRNQMRLEMSSSVESLLNQDHGLDVRADFILDEEARRSYLRRGFGNSYDFSQAV